MFHNVEGVCFEEKMLWAGVLRRAVFDYVLYKGKGQHEMKWRRAHKFIFGDPSEMETNLSFEEICAVFGWDPDYVRRVVKGMDRGSVKKLESTKFRDDFQLDTMVSDTTSGAKESVSPTHLFVRFLYSRDYRKVLSLQPVRQKNIIPTPILMRAAG